MINFCNNIPVYGMHNYDNGVTVYNSNSSDWQKLISYIIPIKQGIKYYIYFHTVGNRLRITTHSTCPLSYVIGDTPNAANSIIAIPDSFSDGYKISFTSVEGDNYLMIYVSNEGDTTPRVVVTTEEVEEWIEPIEQKLYTIEAENGVLAGSAKATDRTDLSGNIVVDMIGGSYNGTLKINVSVDNSGIYKMLMKYTSGADMRDFKYTVNNGNLRGYACYGDGYYYVSEDVIVAELQQGNNEILIQGNTTTYAPMFDSFTIYNHITEMDAKYLIKSNDVLYTITDDALTVINDTELNAVMFKTYGVNELPTWDILSTLVNPEILMWYDSEKNTPKISVQMTATPQNQIVTSNSINLMHESIKGIESATATCNGALSMAISTDDKVTWKAHNSTEWLTLSDDYSGMSKEQLEAITVDQWNELIQGVDKIYIRIALTDVTQSVEEIVINFAN